MKLKQALKGKLTKKELERAITAFDIIGNIAVIEVPDELVKKEKIIAKTLLGLNKNIKTVLKKAAIHKGVFRTQKLKYLAGVRTKETIYKENNVRIKLNVEKVYFSPRLSTERKRMVQLIKLNEKILVMFSGCAPYPLVISKNTKAKEIFAIEINKTAHRYAEENIKLNKANNVKLFLGDVRKVMPKLSEKFDRILMPLPKTGKDFLETAFLGAKKGTTIHFYDFQKQDEFKLAVEKIKKACKKAKLKCRILRTVKCGQYSPYVFRICVDFRII